MDELIEQCRKEREALYDEIKNECDQNNTEWKLEKKVGDLDVFRRKSKSVVVRGKMDMTHDAKHLYWFVMSPMRSVWDPECIEFKNLDVVEGSWCEDNGVFDFFWMGFEKPAVGVGKRDLLLVRHARKEADGSYIIVTKSVAQLPDKFPEAVKGYVRAEVYLSGFIFKPVEDHTECHYLINMTPGGWMPNSVAKLSSLKQALSLQSVDEAIKEGKHLKIFEQAGIKL